MEHEVYAMIKVNFYESTKDELLEFAVIFTKYNGKWVFCKHKKRDTYECPGGRREVNEPIYETAKRELREETGAMKYQLQPVCIYSMETNRETNFGMLYFAEVYEFGQLPDFEIEKIELFDELPENWTYPLVQPFLLEKIQQFIEGIG